MTLILDKGTLPFDEIGWEFEGVAHESTAVSFILVDAPPGGGPALHSHPYGEVIIVLEGQVTAVVGERTIVATGGQVVVIPANTPHRFANTGPGRLRQVDLHASAEFRTRWL